MMHSRYVHWLRWWNMYESESAGKGRYNGARNKVWDYFTTYYLLHPEEDMDISYGALDRVIQFMKKTL